MYRWTRLTACISYQPCILANCIWEVQPTCNVMDVGTLQRCSRENLSPRISLVIVLLLHIEDVRIQSLRSGLLSSLRQNSISSKKFKTSAINHLDCREELDVDLFTAGTCNRWKVRLRDSKDRMLQSWAWIYQRCRIFQQTLAWPWL